MSLISWKVNKQADTTERFAHFTEASKFRVGKGRGERERASKPQCNYLYKRFKLEDKDGKCSLMMVNEP